MSMTCYIAHTYVVSDEGSASEFADPVWIFELRHSVPNLKTVVSKAQLLLRKNYI